MILPVPEPTQNTFTDVPTTSPFYPFVAFLYQWGITIGTSPTTFSPADPLTREEAAVFLVRAMALLSNPAVQAQAQQIAQLGTNL